MKSAIKMMLLLSCFGLSQFTFAQGSISYGLNGEFAIPIGDFGDAANLGFGGTGTIQMQTTDNFFLFLRSGYIRWGGKDINVFGVNVSSNYSAIPIMGGGAIYLGSENPRVYLFGELGVHVFKASAESNFLDPITGNLQTASASSTETEFSAAPGIGVIFGEETQVSIAGRFNYVTDKLSYIGFRIGILFGREE